MTKDKCMVKTCCCGCSLRSGTLAIAIFNIVLAIVMIVLPALAVAAGVHIVWPQIVAGCIRLIISAVLINGVRQENYRQVMAWVWIVSILTAVSVIITILFFILGALYTDVILDLIGILLNIYFIIVVRSFAFKMGTPDAIA